jgi:hypothetical protein
MSGNESKLSKEVLQIRNLLILLTLESGATSEEVGYATGMGAANIRGMFPIKRGKKKSRIQS